MVLVVIVVVVVDWSVRQRAWGRAGVCHDQTSLHHNTTRSECSSTRKSRRFETEARISSKADLPLRMHHTRSSSSHETSLACN